MEHPPIHSYRIGDLDLASIDDDAGGSGWQGIVRTYHHGVRVFSFRGDQYSRPFTTLHLDYAGQTWHRQYPRAYHKRWLGRLARVFSHGVLMKAKKA